MISLKQRSIFALISRIILGAVLIVASFDKILHPEAFAKVIGNYNVLPFGMENVLAIILPTLELFIGCCLILGIMLDGSAIITAGMMGMFIIALSQAMIRGIDIDCGCFKQAGSTVGLETLARDLIWLAMSILVWKRENKIFELFPKSRFDVRG